MEDDSRPRGEVARPDDDGSSLSGVSPTATTAATATAAAEDQTEDQGHMQQHQHDQQGHGVGAREPGPFGTAGDEGSLFAATATGAPATSVNESTTATAAGHEINEQKDSILPANLATSPRSSAPGFVAPSSYLRPLAREREDHHKVESRPAAMGEPGAKRIMHPLDREQREGLVSGLQMP